MLKSAASQPVSPTFNFQRVLRQTLYASIFVVALAGYSANHPRNYATAATTQPPAIVRAP